MTLPERALEIALAEAKRGVREHGHNAGADVERYLAAVNLPPGSSWCASFVVWAFQQAGADLGVLVQCVPPTGGVLKLWERAPSWARVPRPVPGAVFIVDHGKGLGHTGFVSEVIDDHIIRTCEGNTNPGGSREGDGVYVRTRRVDEINVGYLLFDLHRALDEHELTT